MTSDAVQQADGAKLCVEDWEYYLGGYQVIKKWLSYQEEQVLGRALRPDEARYVTEMIRRIAAILLLQPRLDENYQNIKQNTFDWSRAITRE